MRGAVDVARIHEALQPAFRATQKSCRLRHGDRLAARAVLGQRLPPAIAGMSQAPNPVAA